MLGRKHADLKGKRLWHASLQEGRRHSSDERLRPATRQAAPFRPYLKGGARQRDGVMAKRGSHSLLWCAFAVFLLAAELSAASFSLTPHTKYRRHFTWAQARRFIKETQEQLSADLLHQMEEATRAEYKEVPHPIAHTSQLLHEGINCSRVSSDLHLNNLKGDVQLRPTWILNSRFIGDCPTRFVSRELPPKYFPPVVLEAQCACGGAHCSQEGHQCVPVSRHVPVWVRRGPTFHVLDVIEVKVACICARRRSYRANNLMMAAIQS
ncbi:uncharacterized protein LOC122244361 [Penaeus japonicus]|uniref:uncharacterized protein LOC122244361 n=1 Tax=Penaeus japonicus TaxID=27405 RepID=UPI001C71349C|nr:uncharacterized protein LOC122244361 [Penaeus japonicus]